jgi:hypothetical protein
VYTGIHVSPVGPILVMVSFDRVAQSAPGHKLKRYQFIPRHRF